MCRFRAARGIKSGDDVRLVFVADSDRHTDNPVPDGDNPAAQYQTPLEDVPHGALDDFSAYELVFDAGRPNWWTDDMTASAKRQFEAEIRRELATGEIIRKGDLDLSSLTAPPEGVTLRAGGDLYLRSLTALPKGVTLRAGGDLDLRSLTAPPEGVTLRARGHLDLRSLTVLPEGVTLRAGGDLDLRSLTALPEGVTLRAGAYLYLGSLTVLPEGVTLCAEGDLYLHGLTALPEGVTLRAGGYLGLSSLTALPRRHSIMAANVYYGGMCRGAIKPTGGRKPRRVKAAMEGDSDGR